MSEYRLDYLEQLETESIHIFREIAAQFERPVLLFSGGKDSITLVHLAKKAFAPGKLPFPLMHIDTGHNFPEALEFRDMLVEQVGASLIVRKVEDTIREKKLTEPKGKFASRSWLQTYTLLDGSLPAGVPPGTWTVEGSLLELELGKIFSRDAKTIQVE